MSVLLAVAFDAQDPGRLAEFWAGVLGREVVEGPSGRSCPATTPRSASGSSRADGEGGTEHYLHLHLTSDSEADQQQKVAEALGLGARHLDVGQRPEEGHVVLADPEGNEFCVIEAGNRFLAGCGLLGELACDGDPRGRPLLERGAGLAAGVGPGRGDRDPVAVRRHEGRVGRPARRPRDGRNRQRFELVVCGVASERERRSTGWSPSGPPGSRPPRTARSRWPTRTATSSS